MKRKSLSKTVRFEVFKRDSFTCQYCGQHPPAVMLELDHVLAVANGGGDDEANLLTACFDCNRGKGVRSISVAAISIGEKAAILAEKEAQLRAYQEVLAVVRGREDREIDDIQSIFELTFKDRRFKAQFKDTIRRHFLAALGYDDVAEAMDIACDKFETDAERAIKYFCGICWRKVKGNGRNG